MGGQLKQQWHTLCMRWGKDRLMRMLIWVGVIGMVLLAVSEMIPGRKTAKSTAAITETQVEQALEQRITDLLRQVEGVGYCQVMVTLDSSARTVYASDVVTSVGTDGVSSLSESYLTVDTDSGPMGLLLNRIGPTVRGVAVVCDGGGDAAVQQRVIQIVTTAFHISERRVCVVNHK